MTKFQWAQATYQTNVIGNAVTPNSAVAMGNTGGIANVTSMVPFFTTVNGGLGLGNISSLLVTPQLTYSAGNLTVGTGNTAVVLSNTGYIYGNGAHLTGVASSYGNADVEILLASGNVTTDILTTGNISATGFVYGNGAFLTGLPAGYANADVAAYLSSGNVTTDYLTTGNVSATGNITVDGLTTINNLYSPNFYSNAITYANATGYLTTTNLFKYNPGNGVVTAGGLEVSGDISAGLGNVTVSNVLVGGNIYAPGEFTSLVFGPSGNYNMTWSQYGFINTNVDIQTAGNLSATSNVYGAYATFNDIQLNDLSTNAILYTNSNRNVWNTDFSYNSTNNTIAGGNISLTGNIYAGALYGDGYNLSNINAGNIVGSYGNSNVAAYLPNYNGNIAATVITNSQPYITSLGTLGVLTVTGNVTAGNTTTGILSATGNVGIAGNLTVNNNTLLLGNLTVQGNTVFNDTSVIVTNDKYVILANNQSTSANVNGSGIIAGNPTVASLLYNDATASWQVNLTVTPQANNAVSLGGALNQWNTVYANTVSAAAVGGTLTTANQPNISAVGVLGNLSVVGNVTGGFFYGDGSNLSNINAGNITGSYGNSNVANYLANGSDPTIVSLTGALANVNSNVANTNGNVANLTSSLANTNSNVTVLSNTVANNSSNISTLQTEVTSLTGNVYGNSNVAVYLSSGTVSTDYKTTGNVSATGTATASNLYTAGVVSAAGNARAANFNTAGLVSAAGNIVTGSSVLVGADVSTTGNVNVAGDVSTVGNVNFGASVYGPTGYMTSNLFIGPNANATGLTNPIIVARGAGNTYVQAAFFNNNGFGSADLVTYANNGNTNAGWSDMGMTGNTFNDPNYTITAPNDGYFFVDGIGGVGGNLVIATGGDGDLTHSDIVFATQGFLAANEMFRVQAASNTIVPFVDNNVNLGSDAKHFANLYIGNVNTNFDISAAGNVTANNINAVTDVSALGNVNAQYLNTVGAIMSGNLTVTGAVVALGGINASVSGTITNAINVVGNTQGNINTVGQLTGLSVAGNILQTGTGNTISTQGNVYANNLSTANNALVGGLFSAVGNVQINGITTISNNAIVTGNLNVLGNLVSVNQTNLNVSNAIIGLGRGDGNTPLTSNDGYDRGEELWYYTDAEHSAFIGWQNATGNILFATNVSITNNVVTVNSYGSASAGNINAQGAITATGNVYGGNLTTLGLVSASSVTSTTVSAAANVTAGNILTSGIISAQGNATAGNIAAAGVVSAAGNVTAGNIASAGTISTTGNAVHGNVATAGQVSAAGLIYGASFVGYVSGNLVTPSFTQQTVAANAQTITLSNTSAYTQYVSGGFSGTTVSLPDATTETVGATYTIVNSTGNAIAVQTSTGNLVAAQSNPSGVYVLNSTANNSSLVWSYTTTVATGGATGTGTYVLVNNPTFVSGFDGPATFNALPSVNTLNLGNGATTLNIGGNSAVASNTLVNLAVAPIGTGNVKQVNIATGGLANSTTTVVIGTNTANATSAISLLGNVAVTGIVSAASITGNIVYGNSIAIGNQSGANATNGIAIGLNAGGTGQSAQGIAIGANAGNTNQSPGGVAIGYLAGQISQQGSAVAIGSQSGITLQGIGAVAVGFDAGQASQSGYAIAIGANAGQTIQGSTAIAIGRSAGINNQGANTIALGYQAGANSQLQYAIALGYQAGAQSQLGNSVAIGVQTGQSAQGGNAVAVGGFAGQVSQQAQAVAVGWNAGQATQGGGAIAVGPFAGQSTQQLNAVAVGQYAGYVNQGQYAVGIGASAGVSQQGVGAVAIGQQAGGMSQQADAVAISSYAGWTLQGTQAVAIGHYAGAISQGAYSVAIGGGAGFSSQATNTIILNATGSNLTATTANAFYVNPVRNDAVTAIGNVLVYNTTTKEIAYSNTISIAGNVTGGNVLTGGLLSVAGNVTGGNITTGGIITLSNATNTANIFSAVGNISTAGYYYGNGALLTGIITSVANINNGNTNVTAYANANVAVTVAGVANTVVFTNSGIVIASAAGNVVSTTGNIATGVITAGNISGGYVTVANAISIPSTATANGTGATTVYTASSAAVEAVQLTVRAQIGSPATSVQMLQIMAAQDATGNISYTVYDRVNTNTAVAAIPVTVTNTGNVISVSLNSSSTTYYTLGVTEFAQT